MGEQEPKAPDGGFKAGAKSFLAGGAGGMSLVLVGHPLDTIKVRIQTAAPGVYSGIFDVVKKAMTSSEGLLGLYKGMGAPLAGITPIFALYFLGFDKGKDIAKEIGGPLSKEDGSISRTGVAFAGGFSALPATILMVPGDQIKVILQTAAPGQYAGPIDCGRKIVAESGIRGLYKGTGLTLLRDCPGSMAYYGMYEILKEAFSDGPGLSVPATLSAGGLAGCANWCVSVPPDVIKSRLQSAPTGKYPGGGMQVFKELMAKEGVAGLFKGLGPAMIRAFPANAACFMGYEVAMKYMNLYW